MSKYVFSNEVLQVFLKKWVAILSLQEWDIHAEICSEEYFTNKDCDGETLFLLSKAQATIHILDPNDYPNDASFEQDMEITLVHELLHLKYAGFQPPDDSPEHAYFERGIQTTAKVLVGLCRESERFGTSRVGQGAVVAVPI